MYHLTSSCTIWGKLLSCKEVYMKRTGLLLAVVLIAFSSCNFNFTADKNETAQSLRCVTETAETVQLSKWYDGDTLKYYDEKYILPETKSTTRLIGQIQSYTDSGNLKYSYHYSYNAAGLPETVAYYDSTNALKWFYVYEYVTVGTVTRLSAQYEYDGANVLQCARKFTWTDTGLATGELKNAVLFDESKNPKGGLSYYYLPDSKKWNMEISWGTDTASIGTGCAPSVCAAEQAALPSVANHGLIALTAPTGWTLPGLAVPDDLSTSGLAASLYRFQYEDAYGVSRVSLDKDWYPASAYRTDTRMGSDPLLVELSYDSAHRIVKKTTTYGATKALVVNIAYDADNFPTTIATSGAAMLLPLEYGVEYGTNHQIKKISVTSGGSLLRYFTYSYTAPTKTVTAPTAKSLDPFAFIDSLLSSAVTISEFDGDNKAIETFVSRQADPVAGSTTTGVIFEVHKGAATGELNGSFTVTISSSGIPVALSAKKADGTELWNRDFGAQSALLDRAKNNISGLPASLNGFNFSYGRLLETYVPSDGKTPTTGIVENFVYDLLF